MGYRADVEKPANRKLGHRNLQIRAIICLLTFGGILSIAGSDRPTQKVPVGSGEWLEFGVARSPVT